MNRKGKVRVISAVAFFLAMTACLGLAWKNGPRAKQIEPWCALATMATPVNLRGEKAGQLLPVADHTLRINLRAYAPASFVLN